MTTILVFPRDRAVLTTVLVVLFGVILMATPVYAVSEVSGTFSSVATSTSGSLGGTVGGGSSATGEIGGTSGGSLSGTVTGGGGVPPGFFDSNGVGGEGAVLGAVAPTTGSVLGAATVNIPNTGMGADVVPLLTFLALLSIIGMTYFLRLRT